jgi:transposase-like protein
MKFSSVCRTIRINGKQHHLWRAVDQDGEVVDVYLQARRGGAAAKRFFKRSYAAVGVSQEGS